MKTPNDSDLPREHLEKRPSTGNPRRKSSKRREEQIEEACRATTGLSPQEIYAIIDGAMEKPLSVADYNKLKSALHALARETMNLPE